MDSNHFLLFFLLGSSCVFVGFSQSLDSLVQGLQGSMLAGGSSGPINSMPCMQKLLPCQAYLHSTDTPPVTCCLPLKEMVSNDSQCLCTVFNNPEILKTLNVTQEEALKLPKACGANADISVCKNEASSPTTSPATPSTPATSTNSSSSTNSTSSSTPTSDAHGISRFGGSSFIAFLVASVISAF